MQTILAIESSCDETAACVMDMDGTVRSNIIASQIDIHARYGGVVPEIASRQHLLALPGVVRQALEQADVGMEHIDGFGVTYGPGLSGALLCGVNYAKGLAYAMDKPLLGVHHMEGHILANHVTHRDLEPPYMCLVVSGGHTMLIHVPAPLTYRVLGQTRDDAAGEAFDKAARALGLRYPGGPVLEQLARTGDASAFSFTRPKLDTPYDFSFSGLKTAVINRLHQAEMKGETIEKADMAASFQAAVIDFLLRGARKACRDTGCRTLSLVGGVCANGALREAAQQMARDEGLRLYLPDKGLCTDNAVMIAEAARLHFLRGERSGWDLNAVPNLAFSQK